MSLQQALTFLDRGSSESETGYISPDDIKAALTELDSGAVQAPNPPPTVTGTRESSAMTSLLSALVSLGLIIDETEVAAT